MSSHTNNSNRTNGVRREEDCLKIVGGPLDGGSIGALHSREDSDSPAVLIINGHFYRVDKPRRQWTHMDPLRCPRCGCPFLASPSGIRPCMNCLLVFDPIAKELK